MAEMRGLRDEFKELFYIKDRVKTNSEEAESIARMALSASIDEGFENVTKRLERVRNGLSLIVNDTQYQPSPADGDKNTLIVLTILNSILLVEARHALKTLREVQGRIEGGSAEVVSQIETISEKVISMRSLMTEITEIAKGTIGEDTVKQLRKKYKKYIDKISEAMESEMKGALTDELKVYVPERPSLWKRILFFWKYKKPEEELPEVILELAAKAKRGEINKSATLPELKSMVLTERPAFKIDDKDIEKAVKKLQKKGQIPGFRDSPMGRVVYLSV